MTETRVSVTLTFTTSERPAEVRRRLLDGLDEVLADRLETVTTFDLDDLDAPEQCVQLVIDERVGIVRALVDRPEFADARAAELGGVVVELPIETDHRGEENR